MANQTIVTLAELQNSARTFEKQLLQMPVVSAQQTLQYMHPYPGVLGQHVLTEISGKFEVGPYKRDRWNDGEVTLTPRTLETHLGNNALNFAPGEIYGTIFGDSIFKGEALKSTQIASDILMYMAARLGKSLNMAIFAGKYNADGDTTADLFDGFDTITETEITAGNISADKGNYTELAALTTDNVVDQLQALYDACSDELQNTPVNIYLPRDVYRMYLKAYKLESGAVVYNDRYEKTTLEGSDGLATFVPLVSKKGSSYIHIAPKDNMCYGFGGGLAEESVSVEKYKPWEFTLEAAYCFGVQFASLSPEVLHVGKLVTA